MRSASNSFFGVSHAGDSSPSLLDGGRIAVEGALLDGFEEFLSEAASAFGAPAVVEDGLELGRSGLPDPEAAPIEPESGASRGLVGACGSCAPLGGLVVFVESEG